MESRGFIQESVVRRRQNGIFGIIDNSVSEVFGKAQTLFSMWRMKCVFPRETHCIGPGHSIFLRGFVIL